MKCQDCLHFPVCKEAAKLKERMGGYYSKIETLCLSFLETPKPQGDFVRVVRCGSCERFDAKKGYGICRASKRVVRDYDYCSIALEKRS